MFRCNVECSYMRVYVWYMCIQYQSEWLGTACTCIVTLISSDNLATRLYIIFFLVYCFHSAVVVYGPFNSESALPWHAILTKGTARSDSFDSYTFLLGYLQLWTLLFSIDWYLLFISITKVKSITLHRLGKLR